MPKGVYDRKSLAPEDRFWSKVDMSDGCWEWGGYKSKSGYGRLSMGRNATPAVVYAHRFSYKLNVSAIPEGMTVDHLCFNPSCVRPDHLRLLTPSDNSKNTRKANATHCDKGHAFDGRRDSNGRRRCWECSNEAQRSRYRRLADVSDSSDT